MTTIGAAWRAVRDRFRAAGISTPELDAKVLAREALGRDLNLGEHDQVDGAALARLEALAGRRLAGEPVARILGTKEFYGLEFTLNEATLVPRPETELLVDLALQQLHGKPTPLLLDLGTGSGCIAISVLHELPKARGVAADLSARALEAAAMNAQRHGVAERLTLLQGPWFAPLADAVAPHQFDLIVSNPPYIESRELPRLMREVREFDPALALDGGVDGLDAYREIVAGAAAWLRPGGTLACEIGSTQAAALTHVLAAAGFAGIVVRQDLAGLDRVVLAHHVD